MTNVIVKQYMDTVTHDEVTGDMGSIAENPEDILLHYGTAMAFAGKPTAVAMNLAKVLLESNPITLARFIESFADGGLPPNIDAAVTALLAERIRECSADELNIVIHEAKKQDLWQTSPLIRKCVRDRNDELAGRLSEYTNPAAIGEFLTHAATSDGWVPSPIFDKAGAQLRQLAKEATSVGFLDAIMDVARDWNLSRRVRSSVISANKRLINNLREFRSDNGYLLQRGSETLRETNDMRVLRMLQDGYLLVLE